MIVLYFSFFVVAAGVFALLFFFAPSLPLWIKALIAAGLFVTVSIAATAWIHWAAQQLPEDAEIIVPLEKRK